MMWFPYQGHGTHTPAHGVRRWNAEPHVGFSTLAD